MPEDLLARLERTEVDRVGKALAGERGLSYTPSQPGEYVSGTLKGSVNLASGRFAMIDNGLGLQLVPWQPVLENQIVRHISGVSRGDNGIDWDFGRKRGLSAMPANNRLADLKNQIAFVTEGNDVVLAGHSIPSIEGTICKAQGQFNRGLDLAMLNACLPALWTCSASTTSNCSTCSPSPGRANMAAPMAGPPLSFRLCHE